MTERREAELTAVVEPLARGSVITVFRCLTFGLRRVAIPRWHIMWLETALWTLCMCKVRIHISNSSGNFLRSVGFVSYLASSLA